MSVRGRFDDDDLDAIQDATRAAERDRGVEIVCVLVGRCDPYGAAIWKSAALGALVAAAVAALVHTTRGAWGMMPVAWIVLPVCVGTSAGALAAMLPVVRRLLAGSDRIDRRVDRRAATAAIEEGVFDTRDRRGVMLFVALFEHRVRILADRGLRERVRNEAWTPIADELAARLRAGGSRDAVLDAIAAMAALLAERGVHPEAGDDDELSNVPRVHDA